MFYKWISMLSFCALFICQGSFSLTQHDIRAMAKESIDNFKLKFLQKLEERTMLHEALNAGKKLQLAVQLNPVDMEKEDITLACVAHGADSESVFGVTSSNILTVLKNFTFIPLRSFPQHRSFISLQAVEYGSTLLLIAQHTNEKKRHFIKEYLYNFGNIERGQKINLSGPSLISSTKMGNDSVYIAVTSTNAVYHEFRLYQYTGTFDKIFSTRLYKRCSALAVWINDVAVNIALSFIELRRVEIKKFIQDYGEMYTVQNLDIEASAIKYFEDDGFNYLACGTTDSIVIYWWTGSSFQHMQTILFDKNIQDIAIHSLLGRTVLAVLSNDEVQVLIRGYTAQYEVAGVVHFSETDSLKNVLLWRSGSSLLMLSLSGWTNSAYVHKLSLEFRVADYDEEPDLKERMKSLDSLLNVTQQKIDEVGSKVEKMSSLSKSLETAHKSLNSLNNTAQELINEAEELQTDLERIVLKTGVQNIEGKKIFQKLTIQKVTIEELKDHVTLNSALKTSNFPFLLKQSGNQVFETSIDVFNVSSEQVNVQLLNGKHFDDYLLLKGSCITSGNLTFGNVSSTSLLVNQTINEVYLEDLILTNKEQDIKGVKTFKNLSSDTIWAETFNDEIHFDELKELIFFKSNGLISPQNITSNLTIEDNLTVNFLNSFNLSQLFSMTVKKAEEEAVIGKTTFKSLIIKGNLIIGTKINNFSLDNLMTTKTDQIMYGDVLFSNSTFFKTVATDSLNQVDLSEQAVTKQRESKMKGVKTFVEHINVSHISMKEGVLIDSYDPSTEVPELILKSDDGSNLEISNITIGNIHLTSLEVDAENFPFLKELENTWLKSKEQNISLLQTKNMSVRELRVSKMNNLTTDDFVTVKDDTCIDGSVHFVEGVLTQTLSSEDVNKTFSTSFGNPDVKIRISNNITIDKAVMENNLLVNRTIKNFESGFLHAKQDQIIEGETVFELMNIKDVVTKNLSLEYFNNINFTDFLGEAVVSPGNRKINNKHFRMLKGANLLCNGTLNNVSLNRIAMTDSDQYISFSWSFLKAPSFKNISVNNLFDNITLEDVVHTDEIGKISNKQFNGKVTANQTNTSGFINGINITDLQLKYFSKSKDIVMNKKLTFQQSLEAKEIHVNGSKIDDIDLENIICLRNFSNFECLNASNIAAENVTVTGKLNNCDWISVLEKSLLSQSDSQNVTSNVTVRSLVIYGNITVVYMNGAKIPDWISLMSFYLHSTLEGDLQFENISVDSLSLQNVVNNISINFLIHDAVQKSIFQVIHGVKEFKDVVAKNTTIKTLNSNFTCGVNVYDISEYSVSKNGENRTVYLENRILGGLVTNRTFIKGSLNKMNLPTDLVLVNTSEVIDVEVKVNSTLNASAGITLSKINEINFVNFLKERVTLNTSQAVSSRMNFTEDAFVIGNATINGTLNNIDIKDVVKKKQNQSISGVKNFMEELEVKADFYINGTINGICLDKFLWVTRNETLKDVTLAKLNASSLIIGTINGIDVNNFYDYTHDVVFSVRDKLNNFTSDLLSFDDSLRFQRDAVEDPHSLFNYFELHEIFSFRKNPVRKFLPVYEYGIPGEKYELQVTQMVMWISNSKSNKRTKSLVADISSNATFNVIRKIKGKVFPFSLKVEKDGVIGFYVQAEHLQSHIIIKTLYSSGDVEKRNISMPMDATLFDVQLLELDKVFLITAYNVKGLSERIIIYQHDSLNNSWSDHRAFHYQDLTSLNLIIVERDSAPFADPQSVYLSVTGDEKNPGISAYEWDFEMDEFYLKSNISTTVSSYAQWIYNDETLYLLLAKEKIKLQKENSSLNVFNEPVEVYTFEEELILNHSVDIKGVCSLEMFKLGVEVFVLASSNHMDTVYVLQFRGYNGFEVIQKIPAPGITEAKVFNVDSNVYLALNSKSVYSRILKASVRGRKLEDY